MPGCDFTLDELIMLSEPTSVSGPEDVQLSRGHRDIFAWEGDPRFIRDGLSSRHRSRSRSVHNGDYEHPEWAQNLITEFGRRYLGNLHGHLTGGPISGAWDKYYGLAQKYEVGRGRTLGVAIAVHLMVDLPYTLYSIGSHQDQREDFVPSVTSCSRSSRPHPRYPEGLRHERDRAPQVPARPMGRWPHHAWDHERVHVPRRAPQGVA